MAMATEEALSKDDIASVKEVGEQAESIIEQLQKMGSISATIREHIARVLHDTSHMRDVSKELTLILKELSTLEDHLTRLERVGDGDHIGDELQ